MSQNKGSGELGRSDCILFISATRCFCMHWKHLKEFRILQQKNNLFQHWFKNYVVFCVSGKFPVFGTQLVLDLPVYTVAKYSVTHYDHVIWKNNLCYQQEHFLTCLRGTSKFHDETVLFLCQAFHFIYRNCAFLLYMHSSGIHSCNPLYRNPGEGGNGRQVVLNREANRKKKYWATCL